MDRMELNALFSDNDSHLSSTLKPAARPLGPPVYASYSDSAFAADQGRSLSLLAVVEACFRHRARLLIIVGLTMAIAAGAAFLMPKSYEASMQLLVLNAREDSVVSSESSDLMRPETQITNTDVNSQAQLLQSNDVLNEALDRLGKPSVPAKLRDKELERLNSHLDIAPVRDSNILDVSYVASSPKAAKQVLQAIALSFMEKELSLRRPARSREVFQQLVDTNRDDLTAAETTLAHFKVVTGIASLSQDESALLRQLEATSTQSAATSAELAEMRSRTARTQSELAEHPARISTQSRSTPNQFAVEELTTKLVDLENQRTALLARYQPTEPNVVEVEKQIKTVRSEIARQQAAAAVEMTTDVNPVAQNLNTELAQAQITSAALAARQRAVRAEGTAYTKQIDALEEERAQYESLQKRVDEAQRNYDLAVQKRDQAGFDDALDKERILNVAFAAKPSVSFLPIAPKPISYLAIGFFTAIFLGIGSCVLSEAMRSVVYSPAELDVITGRMTLATVPFDLEHASNPPLLEQEAPSAAGVRAESETQRTTRVAAGLHSHGEA